VQVLDPSFRLTPECRLDFNTIPTSFRRHNSNQFSVDSSGRKQECFPATIEVWFNIIHLEDSCALAFAP
jgi:hypothetical protein